MQKTAPLKNEWALLLVLSAISFTQVMDFVIMMPLGPQFMRSFGIGTAEFGWMLSAYTFAAAFSGLFAAASIDRYDRKQALLFLYAGFAIGTLLCALAPSHQFFVVARIIAGAFAGIMTPVTYAIIGDLIPPERRGAANGTVMSSFAAASIAGVPLGLLLANTWSWHAPFIMLVILSVLIWIGALVALPPVREHLSSSTPFKTRGVREMLLLLESKNHRWSLGLIAFITLGGFTVIPYAATAVVTNGGLPETQLPLIYLAGGGATLFSSRLFGKLADRKGALPVFRTISLISLLPVLGLVFIVPSPMPAILLLMAFFMVFISGRFIVGTTLIHNGVTPSQRGGFLSLMAAFQQAASGTASLVGGLLVTKSAAGPLLGLPRLGVVSVGCTLLSLWIAGQIRAVKSQHQGHAVVEGEIPAAEPGV